MNPAQPGTATPLAARRSVAGLRRQLQGRTGYRRFAGR